MTKPEPRPRICDYEGSNYRTEFWEGRGRNYEDRAERIALRRLLPNRGKRLLEVGAGFGRLTPEFSTFEQVVLLDYSLSQLQYAQEQLGTSPHFVYVAADAYKLPFQPGAFDAATMIRVIHHMANVSAVLQQVRRVLAPRSTFILEHANKRNLKSLIRYATKRQKWDPNSLEPVEFVELNFDFHPEYIKKAMQEAGFAVERRVPVSFFRLDALKKAVQPDILAGIDGLLQTSGLLLAPSVFIRSKTGTTGENNVAEPITALFACPEDGGQLSASLNGEMLTCDTCHRRYAIRDGIYDFKAAMDEDE